MVHGVQSRSDGQRGKLRFQSFDKSTKSLKLFPPLDQEPTPENESQMWRPVRGSHENVPLSICIIMRNGEPSNIERWFVKLQQTEGLMLSLKLYFSEYALRGGKAHDLILNA